MCMVRGVAFEWRALIGSPPLPNFSSTQIGKSRLKPPPGPLNLIGSKQRVSRKWYLIQRNLFLSITDDFDNPEKITQIFTRKVFRIGMTHTIWDKWNFILASNFINSFPTMIMGIFSSCTLKAPSFSSFPYIVLKFVILWIISTDFTFIFYFDLSYFTVSKVKLK